MRLKKAHKLARLVNRLGHEGRGLEYLRKTNITDITIEGEGHASIMYDAKDDTELFKKMYKVIEEYHKEKIKELEEKIENFN
jgi:hypothetical protein